MRQTFFLSPSSDDSRATIQTMLYNNTNQFDFICANGGEWFDFRICLHSYWSVMDLCYKQFKQICMHQYGFVFEKFNKYRLFAVVTVWPRCIGFLRSEWKVNENWYVQCTLFTFKVTELPPLGFQAINPTKFRCVFFNRCASMLINVKKMFYSICFLSWEKLPSNVRAYVITWFAACFKFGFSSIWLAIVEERSSSSCVDR